MRAPPLFLAVLSLTLNHEARAARPTCPGISGEDCNSVCVYDSGTNTWTCTLDDNGATADNAASAVIVSSYTVDSSVWDYVAWGVTTSGAAFLCTRNSTSGDPVDFIYLYAGDNADDLCFQDDGAGNSVSNYTLDLAGSTTLLEAYMLAGDGEDEMIGSYSNAGGFKEELWGEAHEDDILGDNGGDYINGGTHGDNICGEGHNDTLDGGDGGDYVYGGIGNDTIHGDADGDSLFGNTQNDTIDGGTGGDKISGFDGDDTLSGGDNDDEINGNGGANSITGGNGTDQCLNPTSDCEGNAPTVSNIYCPW